MNEGGMSNWKFKNCGAFYESFWINLGLNRASKFLIDDQIFEKFFSFQITPCSIKLERWWSRKGFLRRLYCDPYLEASSFVFGTMLRSFKMLEVLMSSFFFKEELLPRKLRCWQNFFLGFEQQELHKLKIETLDSCIASQIQTLDVYKLSKFAHLQ
jgi:hypothetical protein